MAAAKKLIIGNWKMNYNVHDSSLFLHRLSERVVTHRDIEVVVAPSIIALQSLSLQVNHRQFKLAAQNVYWRDHGAFTGEVSASQVKGLAQYIIVGHSERRHVFYESDRDTRNKVQAVLRNNMQPILCVGETVLEKTENETEAVLHDQVTGGLANVTSEELERVVIAYEPVWAIGTGANATVDDAVHAAKTIRRQVASLYGKKAGESIRILYGGSVTPENAAGYLAREEVDGVLVGGASIDEIKFNQIIEAAHRANTKQKGKTNE